MLGRLHRAAGHPLLACDSCREAAGIYADLGDRDGLAVAANHIGEALADLRDYPAAIASYQQAAGLFSALGDALGEVYCLFGIGDSQAAAGEPRAAASAWRRGLAVLGDADHPEAEEVRAKLAALPPAAAVAGRAVASALQDQPGGAWPAAG